MSKMTYFRMPMDVRKLIEMEMKADYRRSYQAIISDILHEHFEDKLRLFRLCGIVANKSGVELETLYLAALVAEHSGELSNMLPQIKPDLLVGDALNDLTKQPLDRIWIELDSDSKPCCAHLTIKKEIRTIELPINREES